MHAAPLFEGGKVRRSVRSHSTPQDPHYGALAHDRAPGYPPFYQHTRERVEALTPANAGAVASTFRTVQLGAHPRTRGTARRMESLRRRRRVSACAARAHAAASGASLLYVAARGRDIIAAPLDPDFRHVKHFVGSECTGVPGSAAVCTLEGDQADAGSFMRPGYRSLRRRSQPSYASRCFPSYTYLELGRRKSKSTPWSACSTLCRKSFR